MPTGNTPRVTGATVDAAMGLHQVLKSLDVPAEVLRMSGEVLLLADEADNCLAITLSGLRKEGVRSSNYQRKLNEFIAERGTA